MATSSVEFMRHSSVQIRGGAPDYQNYLCSCNNVAQWLALLLDREEAERNDRRLTYRLRNARLRHPDACIEDVDYRAPRRLDKALFQQLTRGQWITRKQNLIITGPCGVGKSWLACALGQKACRDDFSVLYKRIPRMFAELEMGRADGRYPACSGPSPEPIS